MPISETTPCSYYWHSVGTSNYITEKEKHKYNSHNASFRNSIGKKLLFLPHRKKRTRVINTRKTIPVNKKVVTRKPIHLIIILAVN
jgi:hypothetical protein